MRTIRTLFAVMLLGSAFAVFQADAQNRQSSQSRSSSQTRTSVQSKPSSNSGNRQTVTRQSSPQSRPSGSVQSRPSSFSQNRQPATRPSSSCQTKPSSAPSGNRQPASKPSGSPSGSQAKPSGGVQSRPSANIQTRPSESRPQSGAVADKKPSTTVKQPGDRVQVTRPGYRPGDKKPAQSPGVAPQRPSPRPEPGHSFKPDQHRPVVPVQPGRNHVKPRIHPVHRDFITYDRVPRFWKSDYHYFGHRIRILPAKAILYRYFGIDYYCYDDIWYRPHGGYYVICRPPFGTVLAANLIADIAWTAVRFSYYNTVADTYSQINENNAYIAEQNAVIAQNNAIIAEQNQTISQNAAQASAASRNADRLGLVQSYASAGSEYFYQDGVFYSKASDGEYKVIVPPAGALVETLPEDYEMVTLDGEEYYKVDNTVYKVVLNEGKPYFEVMGQM